MLLVRQVALAVVVAQKYCFYDPFVEAHAGLHQPHHHHFLHCQHDKIVGGLLMAYQRTPAGILKVLTVGAPTGGTVAAVSSLLLSEAC